MSGVERNTPDFGYAVRTPSGAGSGSKLARPRPGRSHARWDASDGGGNDEGAVRPGEREDVRAIAAPNGSAAGRDHRPQRRSGRERLVHLRHLGVAPTTSSGSWTGSWARRRPRGLRRSAAASRLGTPVRRDREPRASPSRSWLQPALSSPGTRGHACRRMSTGAQMAGAENSTLTPRDEDEGLGAGFFLEIAGIVLVGGIIAMIVCLIWWRAVYAWGFLGGFLRLRGGAVPVRLDLRPPEPARLHRNTCRQGTRAVSRACALDYPRQLAADHKVRS